MIILDQNLEFIDKCILQFQSLLGVTIKIADEVADCLPQLKKKSSNEQ